ncbi:uncharacterized protein ATNIH1004_011822 [Aspergillus tanneri]|uniref:Uncharacterized protein n=1 Tax=Aspergillus tanneri TaxID=1220188 RepID=A0A5M9M7W9_9EURO|nr:uncharacterized protein ATNIH1004_011822 [Aspergillus tanneri]KAA8641686.1 hypothetical protein ATNIH1004_011822 [Aspergillus tanneri]
MSAPDPSIPEVIQSNFQAIEAEQISSENSVWRIEPASTSPLERIPSQPHISSEDANISHRRSPVRDDTSSSMFHYSSFSTSLVDTDDAMQHAAYQHNVYSFVGSSPDFANTTTSQTHPSDNSSNANPILMDTDDALQNAVYQSLTHHGYSFIGPLVDLTGQVDDANNLPFQPRSSNNPSYANPILIDTDDAMRHTAYQPHVHSFMSSSPHLSNVTASQSSPPDNFLSMSPNLVDTDNALRDGIYQAHGNPSFIYSNINNLAPSDARVTGTVT